MATKPENNLTPNPTFSSQSSGNVHPSHDPQVDPNSYLLEKFKLYETRARFYLIGSDRNKRFFRVLKIDRCEPSELNISEDPVVYSPQEVKSLLQRIAEGNRATGGLNFVAKVYGVAGCIKFLESYYLILVTKRRQIGCICGHAIYAIDESQMITIPHASVQTDVAYSKSELSTLSTEATPLGVKAFLEPVHACREDFSRIKLTSFDKLIERTCSLIKDVRLCSEPGQRSAGIAGTSGVAPDAIEIQLKSPNWLFGLRKDELNGSSPKVASGTNANGAPLDDCMSNGFCDLNWLSQDIDCNEEDIFKRYLAMSSVDEANGWCGGTLLGDLDENSDIYKHYAQLCQGPALEPFENDLEREQHYADVLHGSMIENVDDAAVEAEMEAALKEYDQVAADLVISTMCRSLAGDPSQLTRWIIGEDKLYRI